jgi:hypothetical protein
MRFLILLVTIIAVGVWLRYSLRKERELPEAASVPKVENDPVEPVATDTPLELELRDAVAAFAEARTEAAPGATEIRDAIAALGEQTGQLETRVRGDEAFARRVHQPVKRLMLALYSVVQRAARASHRSAGPDRDSLIASSVDALTRAADQLGRITEQADEVALRKLQADLEVLETRLEERA